VIDLGDEFAQAAAAAVQQDFDWLIGRGVPKAYLWHGPMRFGVAEIDARRGEFYTPMPGGRSAFIMPTVPLDNGSTSDDIGDLIAWFPDAPHRWWCRQGTMSVLAPLEIERAAWFGTPLRAWSSPLAWLRASGDGTVILSDEINLLLWLGGVATIHADTFALGDSIDKRLREPRIRFPQVMVRERAAA